MAEDDSTRAGCSGLRLLFSRIDKTVTVRQAQGGLLQSTRPDAGEKKTILHGVSGVANPGEVLALMGPSGSGKTTLLDVLAGRGTYQQGEVTVNSRRLSKDMKRSIAYVTQDDIFFGHLTVRDQLTYTALLRLPRSWSRDEKDQEVRAVVERLRLGRCVDTPISLISGGERKRTNIGTGLLRLCLTVFFFYLFDSLTFPGFDRLLLLLLFLFLFPFFLFYRTPDQPKGASSRRAFFRA